MRIWLKFWRSLPLTKWLQQKQYERDVAYLKEFAAIAQQLKRESDWDSKANG